ncbi:AraC family transcriptional regulator [Deefgea piscis]|uniref:AraC family transcriptional regulator n=1 Tax=Deefgea piscis TaxID=2739061 RepID=A0A6M8SUK3_9NEIS|nr:AraC family transcriptional regulator [Deefgea piscis]QKJ66399.1 AraC family transcriptional regulator [Deefgea piscis]
MNKSRTRDDYSRRLMRVVQLLWQEPARNYSLEQIADVAHFSPFHFHRIYREMMGETVTATQQRLRLHFASRDLAQASDWSLLRIAQRAGYQSSAAFVRSFAAAYGVTPGAYRRQRWQDLQFKINQEMDMYTVEFRTLAAPIHLATRRHRGAYLQIGEAFSLLQLALQAQVAPDARWFGLYFDDPKTVAEGQLRSDAAVEIKGTASLPADIGQAQIPAARYAVIEHIGPYSELERAYHWLFGVWLPQSGEQAASVPTIEQYLNDPSNTPPKDLRTEIWLALVD